MSLLKTLLAILIAAMILNAITYQMWRCQHVYLQRAIFYRSFSPTADPQKMIYLISGTLNQPQAAFDFLLDDLNDYNVTYVRYQPQGFRPSVVAHQIMDDIERNQYQATVYSISVGHQVTSFLKLRYNDKIVDIAINPCSKPCFLKQPIRIAGVFASSFVQILCYLIGWASLIQWIPTPDESYSLQLLCDQLNAIIDGGGPDHALVAPDGMILSEDDEFLDNAKILETFNPQSAGFPYATLVNTKHGDTIGAGSTYAFGVHILMDRLNIKRPE